MTKKTVIKGRLEPFFEMGMNGVSWSVEERRPLKKGESSYDLIHTIENGDLLTVFKDAARKKILWKGTIDLQEGVKWVNDHLVISIQNKADPAKWDQMFLDHKPATLQKKLSP